MSFRPIEYTDVYSEYPQVWEACQQLSEHHRSMNKRPYRQGKRAEDVTATRQRIIEAAVRLHGTIGPSRTTIAALADEAGVTRLTVYRHFPDAESLFGACSSHWAAAQTMPDVAAWTDTDDAKARLRQGLGDLYRFYADASPMLTLVIRDEDAIPRSQVEARRAREAAWVDVLMQPFTQRTGRRQALRAAVGHAVQFGTWQSLERQGLDPREAARLMTTMVLGAA